MIGAISVLINGSRSATVQLDAIDAFVEDSSNKTVVFLRSGESLVVEPCYDEFNKMFEEAYKKYIYGD